MNKKRKTSQKNPVIEKNFTFPAPTEDQKERYEKIRSSAKRFAKNVYKLCPDSPERGCAIMFLSTAVFWANAAIEREDEPAN